VDQRAHNVQQALWRLFGRLPEPKLTKGNTALVCVDLQYMDAHPDFGLGAKSKELGLTDFLADYWTRVHGTVLPNVRRLQDIVRRQAVELIHVRVASMTADARDATRRYQSMGLRTPAGSKDAEILPEVAPQGDELVLSKQTSSAFNSTIIERLLRNLGIENLIIVGVVTNGCIESTVRSAAELDFGTIVVSDATAAMTSDLHDHALLSMSYKDAVIKTTDEVAALLESL
jgi:nicotinamidase-related amidase